MMNVIDLPVDILLNIFVWLQLSDLLALRKVCKPFICKSLGILMKHCMYDTLIRRAKISSLSHASGTSGTEPYQCASSSAACPYRASPVTVLISRASLQHRLSVWQYARTGYGPTGRLLNPTVTQLLIFARHTSVSSRNLATEFLPGWNGKYLLTLTLFDYSSDAENRRYSFELWDIGTPDTTKPIGELLVAGLLGYAVNSEAGSPHVLSVTRRNLDQ